MKHKLGFVSSLLLLLFSFVALPTKSDASFSQTADPVRPSVKEAYRANEEAGLTDILEEDEDFKATFALSDYTPRCQSFIIGFESPNLDYILGYVSESKNLPLTANYDVVDQDGNRERKNTSFAITDVKNPYDGVGPEIGSDKISLTFDIPKEPEETVDQDSFALTNVFPAVTDSKKNYIPDETKPLVIKTFKKGIDARKNLDVNPYFKATLHSYSTFGSYTMFTATFNNNMVPLYQEKMDYVLEDYEEDLKEGKSVYHFNFPTLNGARISFLYQDGKTEERVLKDSTVSTVLTLKGGKNKYRFLVRNISHHNLKRVALKGLAMQTSLMDVKTNKIIKGTEYQIRLGELTFESPNDASRAFHQNLLLLLILILVGYTLVIAGVSLWLYFYKKKKYRNDEFRRVNTSSFVKTSLNAYFASAIVLLDILFIAFRGSIYHNSLQVYNPLDNFIVILSIAGIIYIGYWIKNLVQHIKDKKMQKEMKMLNQDTTVDDGTN